MRANEDYFPYTLRSGAGLSVSMLAACTISAYACGALSSWAVLQVISCSRCGAYLMVSGCFLVLQKFVNAMWARTISRRTKCFLLCVAVA